MTRPAIIAACTAALWVFPSFGTQGMGTLRQAYSHTDRHLFVGSNDGMRGELLLRTIDRRIDALVGASKP